LVHRGADAGSIPDFDCFAQMAHNRSVTVMVIPEHLRRRRGRDRGFKNRKRFGEPLPIFLNGFRKIQAGLAEKIWIA